MEDRHDITARNRRGTFLDEGDIVDENAAVVDSPLPSAVRADTPDVPLGASGPVEAAGSSATGGDATSTGVNGGYGAAAPDAAAGVAGASNDDPGEAGAAAAGATAASATGTTATKAAGAGATSDSTARSTAAGVQPAAQRDDAPNKQGGIRIRALNALMIFLAGFVSLIFLQAVQQTSNTFNDMDFETDKYIVCATAANNMKDGSNYLTNQVRTFVSTQDEEYLHNFIEEVEVTKRRDNAVSSVKALMPGSDAADYLQNALDVSNDLLSHEFYAIKLMVLANGIQPDIPSPTLDAVQLDSQDEVLSPEGKRDRASQIVFDSDYMDHVDRIEGNVASCREELISNLEDRQAEGSTEMRDLLFRQQLLTWALLLVSVGVVLAVIVVVLWPLQHYIARMKQNEPLPLTGAYELRYLAQEYNVMYEENLRNHDLLRRKAEHDHLTGLYNRSVFEKLLYAYREEPIALLLVDADYFKNVNDTLGHDGGDAMLQKIARSLTDTFRSTDYPCRVGGDEFAVIMTEMDASLGNVVLARVKAVVEALQDTSDGLPVMTLSIGVAFSGSGMEAEKLYKHADEALYAVKEAGRNGVRFYRE